MYVTPIEKNIRPIVAAQIAVIRLEANIYKKEAEKNVSKKFAK